MLILNENETSVNLHKLQSATHAYIYDLNILDYRVVPVVMLHEVQSPMVELSINGNKMHMPTHWHLLIADEEGSQLDTVEIGTLAGKDFMAVVYGNDMMMPELEPARVTDYVTDYTHDVPAFSKMFLLCHPLNNNSRRWIHVCVKDLLANRTLLLGDLF